MLDRQRLAVNSCVPVALRLLRAMRAAVNTPSLATKTATTLHLHAGCLSLAGHEKFCGSFYCVLDCQSSTVGASRPLARPFVPRSILSASLTAAWTCQQGPSLPCSKVLPYTQEGPLLTTTVQASCGWNPSSVHSDRSGSEGTSQLPYLNHSFCSSILQGHLRIDKKDVEPTGSSSEHLVCTSAVQT